MTLDRIDHIEILDETGQLVFMVSQEDVIVHNDYKNFTVTLCETEEMFKEYQ